MSTKELKQKLHNIIDNGNDVSLNDFYFMISKYLNSSENCKMVEQSEIDIREGNIYSQSEVQKMIENWTE
jgi:hypothetical protein